MSAWEGSAWQDAQERARERIARTGASGCGHPGCTIVDRREPTEHMCSLRRPLGISVRPGAHQHIACPVHGDHVIRR